MCDILHLRHTKLWLRPDWLFNLTKYGKDQIKLLEVIHGLTKKVIQRKKEEYKSGKRNIIDTSSQKSDSKVTHPVNLRPYRSTFDLFIFSSVYFRLLP